MNFLNGWIVRRSLEKNALAKAADYTLNRKVALK